MKTWNSQNAKTEDFNSVVQEKCNRCQQRKEVFCYECMPVQQEGAGKLG